MKNHYSLEFVYTVEPGSELFHYPALCRRVSLLNLTENYANHRAKWGTIGLQLKCIIYTQFYQTKQDNAVMLLA